MNNPTDVNRSPIVLRVTQQIRSQFAGEASGHDWHHIRRVVELARYIGLQEGAQGEVVELGALLHDVADWKFHGGDDSVGPARARQILEAEAAPAHVIEEVVEIVATISFKGAKVPSPMRSLEGQCVQDADRLDALGAIGIARCFAYGGHAQRPMYDPDVRVELHASAEAYKSANSASLNHFYEKLFHLKDRMNTVTGHRLAEERHRFMIEFEERFLSEWSFEATRSTGSAAAVSLPRLREG